MEPVEQIKGRWHYAWYGSGRRWDAGWLQLSGSAIGGFGIWYWGLKVPSQILDNPALSGSTAIAIGAVCGALVAFVIRAGWFSVYRQYHPYGGFCLYLRAKLGVHMWPIVLIAAGFFCFVVLSGTGLIWLTIQAMAGKEPTSTNAQAPPPRQPAPITPVILASEVEGHIKTLDRIYEALGQSGEQLFKKTEAISFPWAPYFSWGSRRVLMFQGQQQPVPLTAQSAKAAIPEIESFNTLYRNMNIELGVAANKYPYGPYANEILGNPGLVGDLSSRGLTMAIVNLSDSDEAKYIQVVLQAPMNQFIESLKTFREWYMRTKNAIVVKCKEEEASLQRAFRN